jgi:hypothetical protein
VNVGHAERHEGPQAVQVVGVDLTQKRKNSSAARKMKKRIREESVGKKNAKGNEARPTTCGQAETYRHQRTRTHGRTAHTDHQARERQRER